MVRYLRAANVKDGRLDLADVKRMNFTPSEQVTFSLRPGDVLVTEGSGSLGSVGASAVWRGEVADTVCFQNTLLRLRPRAGIEGRYLAWWARSAFSSGVFASVASGANIYHVSAERIRALPVRVPTVPDQRRIADFLDTVTARIDKLVAARQIHQALLCERLNCSLVELFLPKPAEDFQASRLKYLFDFVRSGVWGDEPAGDLRDVVCVRVADFLRNQYRADPRASTIRNIPGSAAQGRILRPGDILLEKSGGGDQSPVGYPVSFDSESPSVCSNFVTALRVSHSIDARFACLLLAACYQSGRNIPYIKQTTGIQNLDCDGYLSQEVSVPARREQVAIAAQFDRELDDAVALHTLIESQLGLLVERRQTLITAAVTGQIDVTAASGGGAA